MRSDFGGCCQDPGVGRGRPAPPLACDYAVSNPRELAQLAVIQLAALGLELLW